MFIPSFVEKPKEMEFIWVVGEQENVMLPLPEVELIWN